MDKNELDLSKSSGNISAAGFMYEMLTKHLLRFTIFIFLFIALLLVPIFFSIWFFRPVIEISQPGTITVKGFFQAKNQIQLIHPFGWQSSSLVLKQGQEVEIAAGGKVTVGYMEYLWDYLVWRAGNKCIQVDGRYAKLVPDCLTVITKESSPAPKWGWVGPEGYPRYMYSDKRYANTPFDGNGEKKILAMGIPHGTLIGHISQMGQNLSDTTSFDKNSVFELGSQSGSTKFVANRDGVLWLAVNDGGQYLHDNLGYFVVSITIK